MENDVLIQDLTTKREAERLLGEIEIIKKGLFVTGEGAMDSLLKNKVRAETAKAIREVFSKTDIDKRKYLDGLEEAINRMPNVTLILAFEPSEGAIERFYSKIIESTGQRVLLNIVFESQIIGGAVIIFNGRYRDYSFKKVFEIEFGKSREKILKMGGLNEPKAVIASA